MVKEQRLAIISLHKKGRSQSQIVRLLGAQKSTVSRAIQRFKELGDTKDRARSGRPRSARTSRNRNLLKKRLQRNPRLSLGKVSRQTKINREAVRLIAKEELGLYPYKIHKVQLLSVGSKQERLIRAKALLYRATDEILFSDEKIFTIEQALNSQNDRIWSSSQPQSGVVQRAQHPQSIMVWGAICASGKCPLVFIEDGVHLNAKTYTRDILEAVLLPWATQHFGDRSWTFQQDSAPAHKAKLTQDFCEANFPRFIRHDEWPPSSPDLNPLDFAVWGLLEARACVNPHNSLASLKSALMRAWERISDSELAAITADFRKRLELCVKAKGDYFEK